MALTKRELALVEALKQTAHVINNILTDSQLDQRTPCGQTIRQYQQTVAAALAQAGMKG